MVKHFVQNQILKIASGRISLQELIFAREFRGLHGYRPGACVPALELTRLDGKQSFSCNQPFFIH